MSNYPDDFKGTNMDLGDDGNEHVGNTRSIATGRAMLAGNSRNEAHDLTEKYFDCLKSSTPEDQLRELNEFNKFLESL